MNGDLTLSGAEGISSRKSVVHYLALAAVWLTVALSAVVFAEPAPFDVLMMGLIILLPVIGLVRINAAILNYLSFWLIIGAAGLLTSSISPDLTASAKHTVITIYLSVASAILAGFVAKNPVSHGRLILNAYIFAALIGSTAAIIGYFDLFPGFDKIFTLYGRARGTFKDPNVFGAFLAPALIYCVHLWLKKPTRKSLMPTFALLLLSLGCLLSFSRGAWAVAALGAAIYIYLTFVTAKRDAVRLKLIILCIFGAASMSLLLAASLQFDNISNLLLERATLDQSYDYGPEGRFGGQQKALNLIVENPLGIGALQFGRLYHSEEVHNIYLGMFLNAGWIGGFGYALMVLTSILLGFRHALRSTATQAIFIVVLAAFTATAVEGWIVDTDHWRHFYVLLGLLWGLMIGEQSNARKIRYQDYRNWHLHPVIQHA